MARPASTAFVPSRRSELDEIADWYRDLLANTPPPADLEWEPVRIGPTWQWNNGWLLPAATLGWNRLSWCGYWLTGKSGKPWRFTPEQARFIRGMVAWIGFKQMPFPYDRQERFAGVTKYPLKKMVRFALEG